MLYICEIAMRKNKIASVALVVLLIMSAGAAATGSVVATPANRTTDAGEATNSTTVGTSQTGIGSFSGPSRFDSLEALLFGDSASDSSATDILNGTRDADDLNETDTDDLNETDTDDLNETDTDDDSGSEETEPSDSSDESDEYEGSDESDVRNLDSDSDADDQADDEDADDQADDEDADDQADDEDADDQADD